MQLPSRIRKLWDTLGPQAIKFGIVGCIGTGAAYVMLYVFVQYFTVYYIYASWVSMIMGQLISFAGYRWWAFVLKTQCMMYGTRFQFVLHWAIWGMGFLIATGMLYSLTEYVHLWYMVSQVFATVVSATSNFLSHKYFTYRPAKLSSVV
jgi:putative flippase GtrA